MSVTDRADVADRADRADRGAGAGSPPCIGVDVGGTFTDAVLTSSRGVWRAKAPTVRSHVGRSVLDACHALAARLGRDLTEVLPTVRRFGLGTTAVTNMLTAGTGARVGLVTTGGFEDALPIAKGRRTNDGVWSVYPPAIVPRRRIVGVAERVDRDGAVLVPLDVTEAVSAARRLVEGEGVDSLAVSFLWSFRNPSHELAASDAIGAAFPGVPVTAGSSLQPTIREFERTAYAVLNAYTVSAIDGIEELARELADAGLAVPVLLVHSGGGMTTVAEARRAPLTLAASGPAAGVAAATAMSAGAARPHTVTCDMGGTSFDVAVAHAGRVPRRSRSEVAGLLTSLSMVDIESIGAGGGSIAWIDDRGMLRVGPHSAGATPGPACYGRGGAEPTLTDALVVLGFLDADRFLGGAMQLDAALARQACGALGARVGLDADACAWGIRRLALDGMTTAVRGLLNARGLDPAEHAITSFGGCGALFTPEIASALGMRAVLVPELAPVLSAFGACTMDLRHERARSLAMALPAPADALATTAEELARAVVADLVADGVEEADRRVAFEADLRFKRQVWELTIPLARDRIDDDGLARLVEDFRQEYVRRYGAGSMMLGAQVELVTLRAVGTGTTVKLRRTGQPAAPPDAAPHRAEDTGAEDTGAGVPHPSPARTRGVVLRSGDAPVSVAAHDGAALAPGDVLAGPALVDGGDTTLWVPPGATATVLEGGSMLMDLPSSSGAGEVGHRADDPVGLELLRSQLQAIAEEAAEAIERTAISPVVSESKDYSATLLDADGALVAGGGTITYHWVAATRAVRATIARYGSSIEPGDVFLANDPYNGGGLHPNDVFVERPVFSNGRLVAWAALSAHLIDMGGMSMGSFAPAATDCYQEAIRIPPVRILRRGEEVSEVWDIFRINVRLETLVEMDLRGLVAGSNVAHDRVVELDARCPDLAGGMRALQHLSERELRRRIATIEDGTYRATSWVEWDDELHELPCTMTVAGDTLHFDFTGAAPQAPHFFNSQPYIVKSGFMMLAAWFLAPDLPYTEGLLEPITLECPAGTVVHAVPPAPMQAGHIHVAFAASEVMAQCLRLALWASPDSLRHCPVMGHGAYSAIALSTWSAMGLDGHPDTWMLMDGTYVGAAAGEDRDGLDFGAAPAAYPVPAQFPDIEILESWYPMLMSERRVRPGLNGAGAHRSGGGNVVAFQPHGTDRLVGQMLAMRARVPLEGAAGGLPGATTVLVLHRADGSTVPVSTSAAGVEVAVGERFEIRCASGGGVGDPLERDPGLVAADVASGTLTAADATDRYGVVLDTDGRADDAASRARRADLRRRRLSDARPARRPIPAEGTAVPDGSGGVPLYPGVVQRGRWAVASASGAALALAPDHWTDGCPVLDLAGLTGPGISCRAYLDPETGAMLYVEVAPDGADRSFAVLPERWTGAAAPV